MAIKMRAFPAFILMCISVCIFAQTNGPQESQPQAQLPEAVLDTSGKAVTGDSSSYFIRETEEGVHFIQKIEWEPVDNILRYEVIIDQRYGNSERYNEVIRRSVEQPFIEISIPPGNYRYKVLVYNLLNRLDGESDYLYFSVFKAVQPRIDEITPRNFYMDEDQPRQVTLIGENFVLGAKIYLVPIRESITNNAENQRGVLVPVDLKYSDIGDTVDLIFNEKDLIIDNYRIVVVNPGGLTSTFESLVIRFQKPIDINVHIGYSPLIPISAGAFHNTYYEVFENAFYPVGFTARASFVPIKQMFGYFGLELSPFYNYVKTDRDTYIASTHVMGTVLSFLYQKPFMSKKLVLNARLGAGFASYLNMYFDYKNGITSEPMNTWFPAIQGGASVQYFVYKKAFAELGLDVKAFFADGMPTLYIGPVLTAGWQF